jgi:hypothetical protein
MSDPWQTRIAGHSKESAGEVRLKRGTFAAELFSNINCTLPWHGGGGALLRRSNASLSTPTRDFRLTTSGGQTARRLGTSLKDGGEAALMQLGAAPTTTEQGERL